MLIGGLYESNVYIDPQYEEKASGFLKKAIIGIVCTMFPIASIVAIFLGTGNHKAIEEYVASGGMHTPKIKTSAALCKGAMYGGIGMTIFYTVYFVFWFLVICAAAFSTLPNQN